MPWITRYVKTVSSRKAPTLAVAMVFASQETTRSDSSFLTSGFQATSNFPDTPRYAVTSVRPSTAFARVTRSAPGNRISKSSRSQVTASLRMLEDGIVKPVRRQSAFFCGRLANLNATWPSRSLRKRRK